MKLECRFRLQDAPEYTMRSLPLHVCVCQAHSTFVNDVVETFSVLFIIWLFSPNIYLPVWFTVLPDLFLNFGPCWSIIKVGWRCVPVAHCFPVFESHSPIQPLVLTKVVPLCWVTRYCFRPESGYPPSAGANITDALGSKSLQPEFKILWRAFPEELLQQIVSCVFGMRCSRITYSKRVKIRRSVVCIHSPCSVASTTFPRSCSIIISHNNLLSSRPGEPKQQHGVKVYVWAQHGALTRRHLGIHTAEPTTSAPIWNSIWASRPSHWENHLLSS